MSTRDKFKKMLEEQLSLHEESDNNYRDYFTMGTDKYGGEKVYQLYNWSSPGEKGTRHTIELGNKASDLSILKMIKAGVK